MTYVAKDSFVAGARDLFGVDADGVEYLYGHIWPDSIVQAVLDALNGAEEATLILEQGERAVRKMENFDGILRSLADDVARARAELGNVIAGLSVKKDGQG